MGWGHGDLRIGVDLDNTIACYDRVLVALARRRGIIDGSVRPGRHELRELLRRSGREDLWTELQGEAYGAHMKAATPFPGALNLVEQCAQRGIALFVISHRTPVPYRGPQTDLHAAARNWLEHRGFIGNGALPPDRIFLETTPENKLRRIASLRCSHFIDDLPDLLDHPSFPSGTIRILFDPEDRMPWFSGQRLRSWKDALDLLLGEDA